MLPASSVSWQPFASAKYSKVCCVNASAGPVAATMPAIPPLLRAFAALRIVVVRRRRGEPSLVEQVLAIDEHLRPAVARDGDELAIDRIEIERALGERSLAEGIDDGLRGRGVDQVGGREGMDEPERERAEDVGQRAGRARGGDLRLELVLGDRDDLDLDAGLGREASTIFCVAATRSALSSAVQKVIEPPDAAGEPPVLEAGSLAGALAAALAGADAGAVVVALWPQAAATTATRPNMTPSR